MDVPDKKGCFDRDKQEITAIWRKGQILMTITIDYEAKKKLDLDWREIIQDMVLGAMDLEGCPYEAEVNVVLTDNPGICQVNLECRGVDAPTDVLSFPMVEYEEPACFDGVEEIFADCFNPESGELMLGDIMISVDKVEEQAKKYGHSQKRELAFLTAHSMLHLFGYDHMEEAERLVMEERQRRILEDRGSDEEEF
jgi:probable rRNA maturation factor